MRKSLLIFGLLALALIMAAPAGANPISGTGCLNNSCFGNIYTLTYNTTPVSSTSTTTTWAVTLTVDTTGYNVVGGVGIDSVAIKVSSSLTSASLVSAPGGTGAWSAVFVNTTLGANGCVGGGSGFACSNAITIAAVPNGTYTWVFNLEVPNSAGLILTPLGASIKVGFSTAAGKNAGITSEGIDLQTQVPEPSSLALLGTGLISVAGIIRRRFAK